MSKHTLALSLAVSLAIAFSAATPATAATPSAAPEGAIHFLADPSRDFSGLSLSAYASSFKKNYKNEPELEFTRINAALGINATRWLTVYGVAGVLEQKVKSPWGGTTENAGIFGLGLWANLASSMQLSFFDSVDRYQLSCGIEGTYSDNDFGTYSSLDGFLFFEVQGDVNKRSFIFPRSLGIYGGPVFSYSLSSDYDTSSSEMIGFGVGLNVIFTPTINLKVGGDFYSNDSAVYAQFGINF